MPEFDPRALEEAAKKKRRDEAAEDGEITPELTVALQKTAGNQAVARLLRPQLPGQEQAEGGGLPLPEGIGTDQLRQQLPDVEPVLKVLDEVSPGELPNPQDLIDKIKPNIAPPVSAERLRSEAKNRLRPEVTSGPKGKVDVDRLLDALCHGVADAWHQWQQQAVMLGVMINAVTAAGGALVGPDLAPLVKNKALGKSGSSEETEAIEAFAGAFAGAFKQWETSVKVPGLPLYPGFAALPMPIAPPTPNVPTPFSSFVHSVGSIQMLGGVGARDPVAAEVVSAVGTAIGVVFPEWLARTQVINMLGTGPVPTFAPPYVPVGPVVGGIANAIPGFLLST